MKVSVVMATYNGKSYVYDQMESIRKQQRQADEVVISDDNSTDGTAEMCIQYIEKYELSSWKVVKTEKNLGYYGNFMNAIKESSGDIIFLADQDDDWLDNKILEMAAIMEKNREIMALSSTFSYIDQEGNLLKEYEKHPYGKKNATSHINIHKYYKHPYYLGMSMAIRRELYDRIENLDNFGLTHDLMFSLYAAQQEGFYYYDKVLTKRRLHGDNTSALTSRKDKEKEFSGKREISYAIWRKLKHYTIMMKILECDNIANEKGGVILKKFIRFQENRYAYIDNKKIFAWLKNIRFINYYRTALHYLNDLRLIIK